jgi:predicted aldo/keto reductase-like oxidoreductase
MASKKYTRRDFIRISTAATAALALSPDIASSLTKNGYDPKGLPTRSLGKTGVQVPLIAIGTGSRFCAVKDEEKALHILTYALDHGLYYWDTAYVYGNDSVTSEKRLGKIVKNRRKEIFLATKVSAREPDLAKKQIEESLQRLQTDSVDLLQIHSLESVDDLADITRKNGVYQVVQSMKEQGITRFIGFTGHSSARAMKKAVAEYDFDTMLIALNHYSEGEENFEQSAIPAALKKQMGVLVMKVIRPRETVKTIATEDLIRYALSLKQVSAAVIGTDSLEVLKANINIIKNFSPLDEARMDELRMSLAPFYKNRNLEWLHPDYFDGYPV